MKRKEAEAVRRLFRIHGRGVHIVTPKDEEGDLLSTCLITTPMGRMVLVDKPEKAVLILKDWLDHDELVRKAWSAEELKLAGFGKVEKL